MHGSVTAKCNHSRECWWLKRIWTSRIIRSAPEDLLTWRVKVSYHLLVEIFILLINLFIHLQISRTFNALLTFWRTTRTPKRSRLKDRISIFDVWLTSSHSTITTRIRATSNTQRSTGPGTTSLLRTIPEEPMSVNWFVSMNTRRSTTTRRELRSLHLNSLPFLLSTRAIITAMSQTLPASTDW